MGQRLPGFTRTLRARPAGSAQGLKIFLPFRLVRALIKEAGEGRKSAAAVEVAPRGIGLERFWAGSRDGHS